MYRDRVSNMSKKKHFMGLDGLRHTVQALWALVTNSFFTGFAQGRIYQGKLKSLCLPGLNCYSCPGSLGSCPIGSLQAVLGSRNFKFSFYIIGFLMLVGSVIGRFVCGWLCPFGLVQDLLYKIPLLKKIAFLKCFAWKKCWWKAISKLSFFLNAKRSKCP